MNELASLLKELEGVLAKHNPGALDELLPPLPEDELRAKLASLNIDNEQVQALYRWRGGAGPDINLSIFTSGGPFTLEEVSAMHTFVSDVCDHRLVPLVGEGSDYMFLFNTNPGPHFGKLYFYSVASLYIDHPISYFDSLTTMVQTIIAAYREGAIWYDEEEEFLDSDRSALRQITARLNPEAVYFKEHDPLQWEAWYEI